MSSNSTSYSYTSSSSSYSTSNGQSSSHSQQTYSNPQGSGIRTTTQNSGQPTLQETREYDAQGRAVIGDGSAGRIGGASGTDTGGRARIEDVTEETDADRLYRERMEDEYAKREGGA
ncbi:MAG: hypothetical protein M1828_007665 [Chrysothrix sp. TS-e1954]|nr:MAG: hypothetical protein M1828_007665 [Chrysothrix sp. TS-e1954]